MCGCAGVFFTKKGCSWWEETADRISLTDQIGLFEDKAPRVYVWESILPARYVQFTTRVSLS